MLDHKDIHIVMPGVRFLFYYIFASLACLEISNSATVHAEIEQSLF